MKKVGQVEAKKIPVPAPVWWMEEAGVEQCKQIQLRRLY